MASRNNRGRGRGLGGDRGRSVLRGAGVVRRSTRAIGTGRRGRGSRFTPGAIQTTANTEQSESLFAAGANQPTAGDHEDRTAVGSTASSRPVYTGRGPPPRSGSGEGNGRVEHFDHEERVLQKTRAFIVVHKSEDVFTALPIYTYQGRGMEGKPEKIQAFHLHVNDGRRLGGDFRATLDAETNDSQELYAIMHGNESENSLLKESAWCKFNYPQTMSLENKKVKILGKLTKFSARKIFMRHYQHVFDVVTFPQPTVTEELEDAEYPDHPADNDVSADNIAAGESTAPLTGQVAPDAAIHDEAVHSTTENLAIVSAATQSSDPNIIEASGYLLTSLANAVEATRSLAASFKIGPSTQATPQTSPTLGIANLRLKSTPGKRSAEDDDSGRSLERFSKRQNRLSGSSDSDLVELSSTGRLRSVPQSRRNSGKDEGKNHDETDTRGIEGVPAEDEMSTNAETDTIQPPETQTSPSAQSNNISRSVAGQDHTHSHVPTEHTEASTSQSVENTRPERLDDSGISSDEIQDVIDIHANAEEPQEIERHRTIQILKSSNHAILSILRAWKASNDFSEPGGESTITWIQVGSLTVPDKMIYADLHEWKMNARVRPIVMSTTKKDRRLAVNNRILEGGIASKDASAEGLEERDISAMMVATILSRAETIANLLREDRAMVKTLAMFRKSHPTWSEDQVTWAMRAVLLAKGYDPGPTHGGRG